MHIRDMRKVKAKMYKLRGYQIAAAEQGIWHLKNYKKPFILDLSVGAGKSLIIAEICHQLDEPVLILCPNKEILEQNSEKLKSYGIDDVRLYSASVKSKEIGKFTYATIQSVYRKPEQFKQFKYVIVDECHLISPKNLTGMYLTFLRAIDCNNVCGLTATPYRILQKTTKESGTNRIIYTAATAMINRIAPFFFKKIAYKKEMQDLIDEGYLVDTDYAIGAGADWSKLKVNTTGSEFTEQSLKIYADDKIIIRQIEQIIINCEKKKESSLTFACSLGQARRVQDIMATHDIEVGYVDGSTPLDERTELVNRFKSGDLRHLVNLGVFTVGFDAPILSNIILSRPTMSVALYYQMVGRGVRLDPNNSNKKLMVYDLVGLAQRFGRVSSIKITKEDDGFRDRLESEQGIITGVGLYEFKK